MNCPNCGNQIDGGRKVCPWCGVLLSNTNAGVIASPGRRLGSHILDGIFWVFIWIISILMIYGGEDAGNPGLILLGVLFLLAVYVIYFILLAKGMSYGKWILGMRVYKTSGQPAGFFAMLIRETIGKMISGMIFGLGYLWLLWDPDKQAWHDKIVGTVVMIK